MADILAPVGRRNTNTTNQFPWGKGFLSINLSTRYSHKTFPFKMCPTSCLNSFFWTKLIPQIAFLFRSVLCEHYFVFSPEFFSYSDQSPMNSFFMSFCRIFCMLKSQAVFHNLPHFSREQDYKVTSSVHYVKIPT